MKVLAIGAAGKMGKAVAAYFAHEPGVEKLGLLDSQAGALEAIACAKTIDSGWIHPTINLENPDPECDLDYVPKQARQAKVDVALSNSFGLGGQNACLVLRKYHQE